MSIEICAHLGVGMRVSTVQTSEARSYASTVSTKTLSPVLSSSYLQIYSGANFFVRNCVNLYSHNLVYDTCTIFAPWGTCSVYSPSAAEVDAVPPHGHDVIRPRRGHPPRRGLPDVIRGMVHEHLE